MNLRTAEAIIAVAYGRSKRADPNRGDTTSEELIVKLNEVIGTYFQEAAKINKAFFGKRVTVPYDDELYGWARPDLRPRRSRGSRTERARRSPTCRSTTGRRKRARASTGTAASTTGRTRRGSPAGDLTFFCSRRPVDVAVVEDEIDEAWPHGHEPLLALELAIYMAMKDNRDQDLPALETQRQRQAARFGMFIAHEDMSVRSRKAKTQVASPGGIRSMTETN